MPRNRIGILIRVDAEVTELATLATKRDMQVKTHRYRSVGLRRECLANLGHFVAVPKRKRRIVRDEITANLGRCGGDFNRGDCFGCHLAFHLRRDPTWGVKQGGNSKLADIRNGFAVRRSNSGCLKRPFRQSIGTSLDQHLQGTNGTASFIRTELLVVTPIWATSHFALPKFSEICTPTGVPETLTCSILRMLAASSGTPVGVLDIMI